MEVRRGTLPADMEAAALWLRESLADVDKRQTELAARLLKRYPDDPGRAEDEARAAYRQWRGTLLDQLCRIEARRPVSWLMTKEEARGLSLPPNPSS